MSENDYDFVFMIYDKGGKPVWKSALQAGAANKQ
jgi:hypothetical protein